MSMSKKDYEALATIINLSWCYSNPQSRLEYIIKAFMAHMESDNPRFDKERFIKCANLRDMFVNKW